MTEAQVREIVRCSKGARAWESAEGCLHFIRRYCRIEDPQQGRWLPFELWPEQEEVVREVFANQKVVILKARQLGLSWLAVAIELWVLLFRPGSAVTLFSRRDSEAVYLLKDRLKGMYRELPAWMRSEVGEVDNDHEFRLVNRSVARAFPTTAGDSYTTTIAVVDEADLVPDLNRLLKAVEPTISAGGKLILLSKADKSAPKSDFKKIYRAAERGETVWKAVFLAWHVRPERTEEWYRAQCEEAERTNGTLDDVHENYPATAAEALAPKQSNKRLATKWLEASFEELRGLTSPKNGPAVAGLIVYRAPEKGRDYVIGADPAEGNPMSDASALTVLDRETWEEVATLAARLEPETFAQAIAQIAAWYNGAGVLVERNNHGHTVLLALRDLGTRRLTGHDGKRGHLTTAKTKTALYDAAALAFRDGDCTVHTTETFLELASIEGDSLSAPAGEYDDRAMSFVLALAAARRPVSTGLI